jgi:hypothetical protein
MERESTTVVMLTLNIISGKTLVKAAVQFKGSKSIHGRTFAMSSGDGKGSLYSPISPENPILLAGPPEKKLFSTGSEITISFSMKVLADQAVTAYLEKSGSPTGVFLHEFESNGHGYDLKILPSTGNPLFI